MVMTIWGAVAARHIFLKNVDGTWSETAKLNASDGASDDRFGVSVAISGDAAIVGAPGDDDVGNSSGSAYVFNKSVDGTWVEAAKQTASDDAAEDYFGRSVSISEDTAIVGAYGDGVARVIGSVYFIATVAQPQCYAQGDQTGDCYCEDGADGGDCSGRPNGRWCGANCGAV